MAVAACSSKTLFTTKENQQLDSAFGSLSEEMIEQILSHLDKLSDRYHASLSCRKLYRITSGSILWEREKKICDQLFSSQFPKQLPMPVLTWTCGAWSAMGLYRKRFSFLYSQSFSIQELASQNKGEDIYSFREHALKSSWEYWLSSQKGLLTLSGHLKFTDYSFSLMLNALEKNDRVTGLDFNCAISKGMTSQLHHFFKGHGKRFTEIHFGTVQRLPSHLAVALVDLLNYTSNLEALEVEHADIDEEVLSHLNAVMDRLPKFRRLLLDCRFQVMHKIEWELLARFFLHPTMEHLWIKGMDDFGIKNIAPCLLATRIPMVCFRSGKITRNSSKVLELLLAQNGYIKLLDLACNVYLDYDQVPEIIRIIRQRPEVTFGISGAPLSKSQPPTPTPKKKRLLPKLFTR